MARSRKASVIKKKLNMVVYGETFTGKSTFASQLAYMHNEDGSPMRILYIDCESGSIDNYIEDMERNGVNTENILILYTSSLAEVLEYVDKVKNNEDIYVLDDEGNETDEVEVDAEGKPFRADAMVIDGASILHMSVQQGLLEFSKKRARVRADKKGQVGDEKLVAIEGSSLETKDWGAISYKGQNLILTLQGSGVHSIVTCREDDVKVSVKDQEGKISSIPTGEKKPAGFKNITYNADTVIRFYRDEDDNVMAFVEKDRTGVHPKETLENPQLLDWQTVIDSSKGKKEFVLRNDLVDAAQTEQELYAREVMGRANAPIAREEYSRELGQTEAKPSAPPSPSAEDLVAEIRKLTKAMNPTQIQAMKQKLKDAGLPVAYSRVSDVDVLAQVLEVVKGA